jgi:hypothetical protein
MILVYWWEVFCSIAIEFKIFEMMLSCSIFKKKQIRGGTFSYYNAIAKFGPMIQSFTLPLHRCIVFTTFILQVLGIMIQFLRQVR